MNLSGSPFDYVIAFLAGVVVSFSPCIYPLIPVTAGFIGVRSVGSKRKGFLLSFVYVSGIAITYAALGVVASFTGVLFGSISSHPFILLGMGIIVILLGISMFDIFQIKVPQLVHLPALKKGDYISTFVLGLASGLIIGPCVTPVLGTILIYLATKQNVFYGVTLLMVFAYGMGVFLILVGIFSGMMASLPKTGKWMIIVKRVSGITLMGIGIYFILRAIERWH
jgi:thiol:disulfide interchange protein DsbD